MSDYRTDFLPSPAQIAGWRETMDEGQTPVLSTKEIYSLCDAIELTRLLLKRNERLGRVVAAAEFLHSCELLYADAFATNKPGLVLGARAFSVAKATDDFRNALAAFKRDTG